MSLLLDTHILIWWLTTPGAIEPSGLQAMEDPANRVFVSVASLWEMAIKAALGRLTIPERLLEVLAESGVVLLAVEADHALAVATLPHHHKDPFDRLLVAQAMIEGLTLVTRDPRILAYPAATIPA